MTDEHRQLLTAALLRVVKAAASVASACLQGPLTPWSWSAEFAASDINALPSWDGNELHTRLRGDIGRGTEAAREHGFALFELARSRRGLMVPLATVTRAGIEANSRAYWLLTADDPQGCTARLASLEHRALSYPQRCAALLRRLPFEIEATNPVDVHRANLAAWAKVRGLSLSGGGVSMLAIAFLEALYPSHGAYTYSGLSGAAHSNEWATANFYDFRTGRMRRDDKMVMEYCMYMIDATQAICDLLIERCVPGESVVERWTQAHAGARTSIAGFINRTQE